MSHFFKGSKLVVLDSNGDPEVGALVNTYELDGITRKTTWTSETKAVANSNPATTNGSGEATLVMQGVYKIVVTDSLGSVIETINSYTSGDQLAQQWVQRQDAVYASTTTFTVTGIDVTGEFSIGRRIKLTDTATLYGSITASSYVTDTTVTVTLDGGAVLSASLSEAFVGLNDAREQNAVNKRFKYLTGNNDGGDVVYSINNGLYVPTVGDVVIIERSSVNDSVELQYWELVSSGASLPASATAGIVNGNSGGDLYVLNSGSNYYQFSLARTSGLGRNLIVGGDFGTNLWQEGTSFVAMADDDYMADLFKYKKSGSMVHTGTKETDAPTVGVAGDFTESCLMLDCTTADAALATGDFCSLSTFIEGGNFRRIAQNKFVHWFWHKHTKVGTYCVGYKNSGADRSYVVEYEQDVSDTWELASAVIDASPSAGTWDYTTGLGLEVQWCLGAGGTYQTTAGAWATGDFFATANQVNACDDAANNFRIALCQLEPGTNKTDFEVLSPAAIMEQTNRYFQYFDWLNQTSTQMIAIGYIETATLAKFMFRYKSPMRIAAGLSVSAATHYEIQDGTGQQVPSSLGQSQGNVDGVLLQGIVAGATVGNGCQLRRKSGEDPWFAADGRY